MTTILAHEKQIFEYEETIEKLKQQGDFLSQEEIGQLEKKLHTLKKQIYSNLKSWDRVSICRHPNRPHSIDYIKNISEEFVEISGDRTFADDHSIICAFARIAGNKFVLIGQEKGNDTESRIYRNFGMAHPEGFRKALRAMQLAEKFSLPVVTFLDTPGAYPGLTAEERGQGWAIARNLWEMARLKTPIIVILIGEGCSGGALGIGVGNIVAMLEHAYYSVISPEGCASILWKDAAKNAEAAKALKIHAENLLELKIIDKIIKEPLGGAHLDPNIAYSNVKKFILESYEELKLLAPSELVEKRYLKLRHMGEYRQDAIN